MLESWTRDFKLVRQASTPPQELEFTFLGCNHCWLCSFEIGTHPLWATVPSANKRLIRASLLSPGLHWVCLGRSLVNGVIISFPPELSGQSQQPRLELSQESAPTPPPLMRKTPPEVTKTKQFSLQKTEGEDGSSDGHEPSPSSGSEWSLPRYLLFVHTIHSQTVIWEQKPFPPGTIKTAAGYRLHSFGQAFLCNPGADRYSRQRWAANLPLWIWHLKGQGQRRVRWKPEEGGHRPVLRKHTALKMEKFISGPSSKPRPWMSRLSSRQMSSLFSHLQHTGFLDARPRPC